MNEWYGTMDWPIEPDWVCETCGNGSGGLVWGLTHGTCRCDMCHTPYRMRKGETILTRPSNQIKEIYRLPVRLTWASYKLPIDQLSDEQWEEFLDKQKEVT